MNGSERRYKIIQMMSESEKAISGKELAKTFEVSRQVIVQDIALLRAQNHEIVSTNQGYLLSGEKKISRVFKVIHNDREVEEEARAASIKVVLEMALEEALERISHKKVRT